MRATETHTYDGKLSERKNEIEKHLQRAASFPKEERLRMFQKLIVHLRAKPCFTIQTEANFNTIIRDFELDNACPNYDPSNHLFAIDLLWLCAELCFSSPKNGEIYPFDVANEASILTNIQLGEMSSGMCPQGRTTRLIQVVWSFLEFL